MKQIMLESTVSQRSDLMTADLHNEIVMMDVDRGSYYGMEEVGAHIWKLLATPIKVTDLVEQLTDSYEVEREQCTTDTVIFLGELLAAELIVLQ